MKLHDPLSTCLSDRRARRNLLYSVLNSRTQLYANELRRIFAGVLAQHDLWLRSQQPHLVCQLQLLVVNSSCCVSSWLTTAMAVERWLVITRVSHIQ